jgi:hypothetical protein
MMQVLRDIGGVEIPDSLIKFPQNEPVATASGNGAAPHAAAEPPKAAVG